MKKTEAWSIIDELIKERKLFPPGCLIARSSSYPMTEESTPVINETYSALLVLGYEPMRRIASLSVTNRDIFEEMINCRLCSADGSLFIWQWCYLKPVYLILSEPV
jgi:hypothetical protein